MLVGGRSGPLSMFRLYKPEAYLLLIFHSRLSSLPASSLVFPAPVQIVAGRAGHYIINNYFCCCQDYFASLARLFHSQTG